MRSAGKKLLSFALAISLVFPAYASQTDIKDAQGKKSTLEEEKKKMEQTLGKLEGLKENTESYVRQLDENLDTLNTEVHYLEGQLTEKEQDIVTAQSELEEAEKTEKHQYDTMKLRIKYMYERCDTSYLDLLMESKDLSELLNRAEYIAKIGEYDREQMDKYVATKHQIEDKRKTLELEREQLVQLKETTQAKQDSVQQLMDAKTTELKNYESRIGSAQGQITEYQKSIEAEEGRIKQIEAEIKRKEEEAKKAALEAGKKYNTVSIGNIKFIWPCPSSGRITSNFGDRESPTEGASSSHQGIDIGAASGSNVVAAAAGEVIISTYSYSAGNYVMINHGGGVYTVYMHNSQLLVSVGEQVSQGQVISKVGSTGYSTGPHLHFGVRVNGSYVNPAKYVSP